MAVAVKEARTGQTETPMSASWNKMKSWLGCLVENQRTFLLSPGITRLVLEDPEFSHIFRFSADVREAFREGGIWLEIGPLGTGKSKRWQCLATQINNPSSPIRKDALLTTYYQVMKQVTDAMESRGSETYIPGDLDSLLQIAGELFEALPSGIQQEMTNNGWNPRTISTTIQRTEI